MHWLNWKQRTDSTLSHEKGSIGTCSLWGNEEKMVPPNAPCLQDTEPWGNCWPAYMQSNCHLADFSFQLWNCSIVKLFQPVGESILHFPTKEDPFVSLGTIYSFTFLAFVVFLPDNLRVLLMWELAKVGGETQKSGKVQRESNIVLHSSPLLPLGTQQPIFFYSLLCWMLISLQSCANVDSLQ